jgi:hypothetical protein
VRECNSYITILKLQCLSVYVRSTKQGTEDLYAVFEERLTCIQFVVMMLYHNEVTFDVLQEKSMMAQRWMSGH